MRAALIEHWRLGAATFLTVLILCGACIWARQTRDNLVFTFSVATISHDVRLPSLGAINPENIVNQIRLSLKERSLHGTISHHDGTFAVIIDSISANSTQRVQQDLSTIHRQLVERLEEGIDPTPLSVQLDLLDARLALVARALQSTELSTYERYTLEDLALTLDVRRAEVRTQLDVVSNVFGPPSSQLYPAEQMGAGVLLLLSTTLAGFAACAAMVLADSLSGYA